MAKRMRLSTRKTHARHCSMRNTINITRCKHAINTAAPAVNKTVCTIYSWSSLSFVTLPLSFPISILWIYLWILQIYMPNENGGDLCWVFIERGNEISSGYLGFTKKQRNLWDVWVRFTVSRTSCDDQRDVKLLGETARHKFTKACRLCTISPILHQQPATHMIWFLQLWILGNWVWLKI